MYGSGAVVSIGASQAATQKKLWTRVQTAAKSVRHLSQGQHTVARTDAYGWLPPEFPGYRINLLGGGLLLPSTNGAKYPLQEV